MGVWAYGRMGVWAYGRMGVWAYGRMGVWAYGRMGVRRREALKDLSLEAESARPRYVAEK
jgi:hypothetical protein